MSREQRKLFCWFYIYPTIINSRDLLVRGFSRHTHPKECFSVLATFPMAFLLSHEDESEIALDDLGIYTTTNIDEVVSVQLHFDTLYYAGTNKLKHYAWSQNFLMDEFGAGLGIGNSRIIDGARIGMPRDPQDSMEAHR